MPTKFKATKPKEHTESYKLKKHELHGADAKQIDKYIDKHVTDMDGVREVLKALAKMTILKP